MDLKIAGISQDYRGIPVLRDVSFSLGPGEHIAIVGPSGCGKSTLLRILTGLERPAAGEVYFDGLRITGEKGHFGFMNQSDLLLPWRRLWENVGLADEIQRQPRSRVRERALAALKAFGLESFAEHYPYQLSGGMRQRAAFLRTYLANKDLLVLDEPFSAVDAITRTQLQRWLSKVLATDQARLLFVTHSVEEALLLASRVLVFSHAPGHILAVKELPFSQVPLEEREFLPEFLAVKKEILALLAPFFSESADKGD